MCWTGYELCSAADGLRVGKAGHGLRLSCNGLGLVAMSLADHWLVCAGLGWSRAGHGLGCHGLVIGCPKHGLARLWAGHVPGWAAHVLAMV